MRMMMGLSLHKPQNRFQRNQKHKNRTHKSRQPNPRPELISPKTLVTSDHHFDHPNTISYFKRPFRSLRDMNETMIKRWNKPVGPNDTVLHLGDLMVNPSEKRLKKLRKRLNGKRIIVIMGNHELENAASNAKKLRNAGFEVSMKGIVKNGLILTHEPIPSSKLKQGMVNVHGHIHNLKNRDKRHINACVEMTNYYPVNINRYYERARKAIGG